MIEHSSPVSGVATCNGVYVATAGYDNRLILWDAKTKQAISVGHHDHLVNQCVFSPCSGFIASSSSDYSVRVWSVPDMRLVAVVYHDDDAEGVAFHPTKSWIATSSRDHSVRVIDLNGQTLKVFRGHSADVISVEWLLDRDEIVSSSDDGTIKRWRMDSDSFVGELCVGGAETDTIAITPDGSIFAGNDDGEILLLTDQGDLVSRVHAHASGIKKLAFDPRHRKLISLSYDRSLKYWNAEGPRIKELRHCELPGIVWPRSCSFLCQDRVVIGTFGSSYAIYDIHSNHWELDHINETKGINSVLASDSHVYTIGDAGVFKEDGVTVNRLPSLCNFLTSAANTIVTGGQDGALYDARSGKSLYQFHVPLNCAVASSSMNGHELLLVGTYSGEALIFGYDDGKIVLRSTVRLHANAIKGIAITDACVFSVSADKTVTWYSLADESIIAKDTSTHKLIVNGCVALGKKCFASISRERNLVVWNDTHPEVYKTPHLNSIKCIASDRRVMIATGDYRGRVGLFSLESRSYISVVRPTIHGISSVTWDEYNQRFLASSYDGSYYSISLPSAS